jgi:glutamine phosphoribosylpyrophosphate amidotransferase
MRGVWHFRQGGRRSRGHPRAACTAAPRPGSSGIVSFNGQQFSVERHVGLIGDTFTKRSVMDRLPGDRAIGHTRYSTTGGEGLRNVQPFFAEFAGGGFAIAHNGNITNALTVQRELQNAAPSFPRPRTPRPSCI